MNSSRQTQTDERQKEKQGFPYGRAPGFQHYYSHIWDGLQEIFLLFMEINFAYNFFLSMLGKFVNYFAFLFFILHRFPPGFGQTHLCIRRWTPRWGLDAHR